MGGSGGSGSGRPDRGRALRSAALALLRFSGTSFLVRHLVQARRVTVLTYHDPEPEAFDRHLALLTSLYAVIPLEDLVSSLRSGDVSTLPRRSLVITLDDGWAGNARLLPVLQRHGVRPAVFLTTAIVGTDRHFWWTHAADDPEAQRLKALPDEERLRELAAAGFSPDAEYPHRQALSAAEIAEMAPWVDFQAHSRSHPILPRCSDGVAAAEIAGSADDIARLTGVRPAAFAYPNGDRSDRDVELVRSAGYVWAFTVEPGYVDAGSDPYGLCRISVGDSAGTTELVSRASGAYGILVSALHGALRGRVR